MPRSWCSARTRSPASSSPTTSRCDSVHALGRRTGLRISATGGTAHRGFGIGDLVVDRVAGQTDENSPTTEDFVRSAGIVTGASGTNSTLNDLHIHHNQISNTGGGGLKIRR
ncbi:hypothetical protein [Streptomyces finlayi]|uniref:hypothetical protein n=1 Tax=Streptomyces finlayi TaxID=67296 RepID=UPI001624E2F9|nr:hypothetical protein [Streptomyces finlayi]